MNWTTPRDVLIPRCPDFKNYGHNEKVSKNERAKILTNNNYTCRYCGGYYVKYLICSYLEDIKGYDVCCRICYLITHLNYGFYNELKLYYSTMPQIDIIKKTVEYTINYSKIPQPTDIDPNVKTVPISLLEYINILNNQTEYPEAFKNYKFFFGPKMNLDFIYENYCNLFTYDNDVDTEHNKIELEQHKPSEEELLIVNKCTGQIF